jgi:hypothetical protein
VVSSLVAKLSPAGMSSAGLFLSNCLEPVGTH